MGEDKLSAAQVAKLLFENIVRFFGVPKELVHNRDPRFTAHLRCELWCILRTKTSASTAFHPQSGCQSEHTCNGLYRGVCYYTRTCTILRALRL